MIPDTESTTQLTPSRLQEVLALPDAEAEQVIFSRIRHISRVWELSYAEVGLLCKAVEAYLLHEQRIDPETNEPCSFHRWVQLCAPRSSSTVYAAIRDVEELKDMREEDVAQIPASNFPVVKQLSTSVRNDPKVVEAAQTLRQEELVAHIRKHHPGQHIEHHKPLRFMPEESAVQKIEEALAKAEARGARNRNEALEMVAVVAMETWEYEDQVEKAMTERPSGEA